MSSEKSKYKATIGLEVHAELATKTKMFCRSLNDPDEKRPNIHICPICMAHPGTLPMINKEAVKYVLLFGKAVKGTLATHTYFDRKNYFYPDIPKGYQISQYQFPLVSGGILADIALTRVHLEEDTARSIHTGDKSFVDYNRAGVPLMELVTEPVIHSAEEAEAFARELLLLLRTLGISHANMEKGEMRVEANISISTTHEFGTKVEVKNLNSIRSVSRSIAYELERQEGLLENGEVVVQETRGFDEATGRTISQRKKENAQDYRYFPDPDLPALNIKEIPEFTTDVLMKALPELPSAKRNRLKDEYGIVDSHVELLVQHPPLADFFESTLGNSREKDFIDTTINYLTSDLISHIKTEHGEGFFTPPDTLQPEAFAQLIRMILAGEISSRGAKDILAIVVTEGGYPEIIARERNLTQVSDAGALESLAVDIISEFPEVVSEYKAGKESALQFLVGQGMKKSKGSAHPTKLKETLEKLAGKNS